MLQNHIRNASRKYFIPQPLTYSLNELIELNMSDQQGMYYYSVKDIQQEIERILKTLFDIQPTNTMKNMNSISSSTSPYYHQQSIPDTEPIEERIPGVILGGWESGTIDLLPLETDEHTKIHLFLEPFLKDVDISRNHLEEFKAECHKQFLMPSFYYEILPIIKKLKYKDVIKVLMLIKSVYKEDAKELNQIYVSKGENTKSTFKMDLMEQCNIYIQYKEVKGLIESM